MKHDEFFRRHPVFSIGEFAEYLESRGSHGTRAQETLLAYHRQAGNLLQIKRGLYAVIPPGALSETYPVDPYLIAGKITSDAVLSYHTALDFHGRSYSMHNDFVYSSARPASALTFHSHTFRGTSFPTSLTKGDATEFGVLLEERYGLALRVTSLERTLVDVLDRPHLSGSWEEIWRSLESIEFFALDTVITYVSLLANATTAAKVGFYLDQHREVLMVEERHLKQLREMRPRQPHYFDRGSKTSGKFASEWNLVIPEELYHSRWGEVL
ncbi:MAG: transcriptional regulator [Bacteroidota bacterium]